MNLITAFKHFKNVEREFLEVLDEMEWREKEGLLSGEHIALLEKVMVKYIYAKNLYEDYSSPDVLWDSFCG